jgi:type IV pilus assembly protein PilZ
MSENREHPRAPIELKVEYRKLNSFFADYTKNISKGGTFIKTRKVLPVGTRFVFHLSVPGLAEPFAINGEVMHNLPDGPEPGMGIRFAWPGENERREFEKLVEALMAESMGRDVARNLLRQGRRGGQG